MKYKEHGWLLCGDLKVLCWVNDLAIQSVYVFYVIGTVEPGVNTGNRSNGPSRVSLMPGAENIARESLVDPQKSCYLLFIKNWA
jgi:hypothetical protein